MLKLPNSLRMERVRHWAGKVLSQWRGSDLRPPLPDKRKNSLDIFNVDAVVRFIAKHDPSMLDWSPSDAESDEFGAARVILGTLRDNPMLRKRFPEALHPGKNSAFTHWFCTEHARKIKLSPTAVENARKALASNLSGQVMHVYVHVHSLRKSRPLAVTPAGGKSFVKWLISQGKSKYELSNEAILWFLQQAAGNPWPLLITHYLLLPDWQKQFPLALTAYGVSRWRDWLRDEHGLLPPDLSGWEAVLRPSDELLLLRQNLPDHREMIPENVTASDVAKLAAACCRDLPSALRTKWQQDLADDIANRLPGKSGVNIIGHFCYPSGLQQAAFALSESLRTAGYQIAQRDQPAAFRQDTLDRAGYLGLEIHDITISVVAPFDSIEKRYEQSGLRKRPEVHRIGVWYWELDQVPVEWIERATSLQELWAPSRFIAEILKPVMPVPVYEMRPGVPVPRPCAFPRSLLGLKDHTFMFLFMFDMCSVMERKNPLGLIKAFTEAFNPEREDVALVIKVLRGSAFPEDLARLREAASVTGIMLLEHSLSQEETHGLIDSCSAYVSLHRSEGFGLTMAEAMLLGKPVIATRYSGNLDFMNADNSLLVDCELVPITEDLQFYSRGNRWAEPSRSDAVAKMRLVFDEPEKAAALGQTARADTLATFSLDAAALRMTERLDQIRNAKK